MTHVDPRLLAVANMIRPGLAVPTIFQLAERPQPARAREIESLGAHATYTGKFVPQVHADLLVDDIPKLERAGVPALVSYDEPVYAFQQQAAVRNPFRSTKEEIEARVAKRLDTTGPPPKPNPHYRSYLGAQGPIMVPMGGKEFTLEDARVFTRSKELYDAGRTGRSAKVAVLDTGMDPSHPMLEGRIIKAQSFVPEEAGFDGQGHGSWTASAVAGNRVEYQGRIQELRGKTLQGMSEARLIDIKVLTSEGTGAQSGICQGLEAAITEGAQIISMSLGSLFDGGGLTPDAQAADEASKRGARVVVAVGNQYGFATVGSPASARTAIAVGACAMQNPRPGAVATFSSKGPTRTGSVRPTIVAPGGQSGPGIDETILGATSGIIAAESGEPYGLLRGSSMATPIVSGVLAQLLPEFPADRQRIEELLAMGTRTTVPRPLGGSIGAVKDNRTGWGVIDAVRLHDALARVPPPGVRLAASGHAARTRPFLSLLANALGSVRPTPSSRRNTLRLTLI